MRWSFAVCAFSMLMSCGTTQPVRVLKDGETQLCASLGGPIVPSSSPVGFIPYLNVGVLHGMSSSTTLQANVHVLPGVFGTLGVDAGLAARLQPERGWRPEITAKVQALVFTDFKDARFYPLLSLIASYSISAKTLAYGGLESVYQFSGSKAFFTPLLGAEYPLSTKLRMQTELKWMAANINTYSGIFEGEGSIGSHGGIAVFLGLNYEL